MKIKGIELQELLDDLHEGLVIHRPTTEIIYANPRALQILRLSENQMLGKNALDPQWRFIDKYYNLMVHQDFPVNQALSTKRAVSNIEVGICDSSTDKVTWVLCNATPKFDQSGEVVWVIVEFWDISSTKMTIPFEKIVAFANDVIVITDAKQKEEDGPLIVYVNKAFSDLTGFTSEEVIGKSPKMLQGDGTDSETRKRIRKAIANKESINEKILNFSKAGNPYWLDMNIFPLENALGEVLYFAAVERNITHQVEKEAELQDLATKDSLTGLLNRRGFFDYSAKQIEAQVEKMVSTIAIIDIDYFKKVNDSFGHLCGDQALRFLTSVLRKMFRENDLLCRYGGEEFALFLQGADLKVSKNKLEAFREEIASTPFDIGEGRTITMTVSIGLAELCAGSLSIQDVINQADKALYNAKKSGRNRTIVYP